MIIIFETTYLAPGQIQAADQFILNAEQIVDEAEFFRAATRTFFPRGNDSTELSFVTHWSFPTVVAAEVFVLTHTKQLPMTNADQGVLQCICGSDTPATAQTCYMPFAVLKSAHILRYIGTSVDVEYSIVGPGFTTSVPANLPTPPNPNELNVVFRRDHISLTPGVTTQAATYSSPLPGSPGVFPQCTVSGPTGSPTILAQTLEDTVTTNGFTAKFSAPIPGANFFLDYIVFM